MKGKLLGAITVALLLVLVFAVVAQAASSGNDVTDTILQDATDGTLDGTYTAAQVQAALAFLQDNPTYAQYSDLKGVLEDYLASLQNPGEQAGELAFTGGAIFLILAAGAGLVGGGALLRRSQA